MSDFDSRNIHEGLYTEGELELSKKKLREDPEALEAAAAGLKASLGGRPGPSKAPAGPVGREEWSSGVVRAPGTPEGPGTARGRMDQPVAAPDEFRPPASGATGGDLGAPTKEESGWNDFEDASPEGNLKVKKPQGGFEAQDLLYMLPGAIATAISAARVATSGSGRRNKESQFNALYGNIGQLGAGMAQTLQAGNQRYAVDVNRYTSDQAAANKAAELAQKDRELEVEGQRHADDLRLREDDLALRQRTEDRIAGDADAKLEQQVLEWEQSVASEGSVEQESPESVRSRQLYLDMLQQSKDPRAKAMAATIQGEQPSESELLRNAALQEMIKNVAKRRRGGGGGGMPAAEPAGRDIFVQEAAEREFAEEMGRLPTDKDQEYMGKLLAKWEQKITRDPKKFESYRNSQLTSDRRDYTVDARLDTRERMAKVDLRIQTVRTEAQNIRSALAKWNAKYNPDGKGVSYAEAHRMLGGFEAVASMGLEEGSGKMTMAQRAFMASRGISLSDLNETANAVRRVEMGLRNDYFGSSLTTNEKRAWDAFAASEGLLAEKWGPVKLAEKMERVAARMERWKASTFGGATLAATQQNKVTAMKRQAYDTRQELEAEGITFEK